MSVSDEALLVVGSSEMLEGRGAGWAGMVVGTAVATTWLMPVGLVGTVAITWLRPVVAGASGWAGMGAGGVLGCAKVNVAGGGGLG